MSDGLSVSRDEGERSFRELADNAPVMIWRSGPDAQCDWFNRPWLEFVGRTLDQERGTGWSQGVHPEDFDCCLETYLGAFHERRSFAMTYRLRRADGAFRDVLDRGAPFFRSGAFAGYFGSCIDITEQRSVEMQLRQALKMEAIGQLTGGVAHDFNNLLQVIGGNLELLIKDPPDDLRMRRRLRNAMDAVGRGSKLASQLLSYARQQTLRPQVFNLGRLIQETDDMLRRALGDAIEIEARIGGGLWNTFVDPVQLETALLNLAVNARDAMGGRGKLVIEVRNIRLEAQGGGSGLEDHIMLAVSDTGCGMSAETRERAFDPFFTTKAEGTGLGLSMVQAFVKQSGGQVRIDSAPGGGASVRLYLPRCTRAADARIALKASAVAGGAETILLVEDDEQVRLTTADMLAELGYTVLEAPDSDAALAILESGAAIDLLFSDVVMPGVLRSGELAQRAQEKLPGIGVLFTSGYIEMAAGHSEALGEGAQLLIKPYTREELGRSLRRILAEPRSDGAPAPAQMSPG